MKKDRAYPIKTCLSAALQPATPLSRTMFEAGVLTDSVRPLIVETALRAGCEGETIEIGWEDNGSTGARKIVTARVYLIDEEGSRSIGTVKFGGHESPPTAIINIDRFSLPCRITEEAFQAVMA